VATWANGGLLLSQPISQNNHYHSLAITLPPLGVVALESPGEYCPGRDYGNRIFSLDFRFRDLVERLLMHRTPLFMRVSA
jgi:hypothetical protein